MFYYIRNGGDIKAEMLTGKKSFISMFPSGLGLLDPAIHFCVCVCINSFSVALLCTLSDGKVYLPVLSDINVPTHTTHTRDKAD